MKTLVVLLVGIVAGVAATQAAAPAASSSSAAAPAAASAAASASATAAKPQGTGTQVHPISKNIIDRLTKSTRHIDRAQIKQGDREVDTMIYYPLEKNKAMAVVLIHEIFGRSDWMKACADQLSEAGYVVVVPDFLSGMGPHKGGTDDVPETQVTSTVSGLDKTAPGQVMADLTAVVEYVKKLPECNGNIAVGGFCWGGGQAFKFSTMNKDIKAAFVFYGQAPAATEMAKISIPVYGFYGGADRGLAAAMPGTDAAMKAAGKTYEGIVYEGAAHGFMRTGQMDNASAADKKAAEESWKRMLDLLKKIDAPAKPAVDAKPAASAAK